MIRLALECIVVFLLPTTVYFGFVLLTDGSSVAGGEQRSWAEHLDAAPLAWLFALGVVCLLGTLLAFATLQEQGIDKPYVPAVFKNGQIIKDGQ